MNEYIIGQSHTDANQEAGFLPSQVATTAREQALQPDREFVNNAMGWMEKTLRKVARPASLPLLVKKDNRYTGKRFKLWKSRETGAVIWAWPERGFIHMERDTDGAYKKWTCRDMLQYAAAMGEQSEVSHWPDEAKMARDAYLLLVDLVAMARAQGDPTEMTDDEKRSLRESVACATVPGMGKITFVGSKVEKVEAC